jgi:hypothetical protein
MDLTCDCYLSDKTQQLMSRIPEFIQSPLLRHYLVSTVDSFGKNMAHQAALHDQFPVLKIVYQEDPALISQAENHGFTCAHCASQNGHLHILKWLVSKDRSLLSRISNAGVTNMHAAAGQGHTKVLKWLHSMNTELISRPNENGWVPAHAAASSFRFAALDWLWTTDSSTFSFLDKNGRTPMQAALFSSFIGDRGLDLVKWFCRQDPSLLVAGRSELEALAIDAGQTELVRWLRPARETDRQSQGASKSTTTELPPKGRNSPCRFILGFLFTVAFTRLVLSPVSGSATF